MHEEIKILKVRFNKTTLEKASKGTLQWALENKQRHICTPNPEFVLEAQNNNKFLKILNKSDLNIPDGTGILWASKYLHITRHASRGTKIRKFVTSIFAILFYPKYIREVLPERVTGTDLMESICKQAQADKHKIFLLGAQEGVAQLCKKKLEAKHVGLNIVGTEVGSSKKKDDQKIVKKLNRVKPNILFVAFVAPAQELWIERNLKHIPSVKVAIGIGGAFDFLVGKRKRAPKWMQKIGLEWLYRLIQQPKRAKRIYNATIKFPKTIFKRSIGPNTKKIFSWT